HASAGGLARRVANHLERRFHFAAGKYDLVDLSVTRHTHFHAPRQGIGDRYTDAVEASGKGVSAPGLLVELAAGMQASEHDLHHRRLLLFVQPYRDASAIVLDRETAVGMQGDDHGAAKAGQGFVSGVVDHLLDDVQRVLGTGVHARALPDRLEAFQHPDRCFVVAGCGQFASVLVVNERLYFTDTSPIALYAAPLLVVCLQKNTTSGHFLARTLTRRLPGTAAGPATISHSLSFSCHE